MAVPSKHVVALTFHPMDTQVCTDFLTSFNLLVNIELGAQHYYPLCFTIQPIIYRVLNGQLWLKDELRHIGLKVFRPKITLFTSQLSVFYPKTGFIQLIG